MAATSTNIGNRKRLPGGPMKRVYESLKGVVQETLQRSKETAASEPNETANSTALDRLKSSDASTFNDDLEELERIVADRIGRLKAAIKEGEAVVSGEAQRAAEVNEGLRANVAALEIKVKETEDTIRRKDSANQRMEESLTAKIHDLQSELKTKEEALENQGNKVNDLQSKIEVLTKRATHLESAIEQAKTEAAGAAERVEHLAESSKAKIAALETQLSETEGVVRGKESAIKALEQDFTAKIQELESQVRNKEELLAGRDKEMNDLKSQLKVLTNGIRNMSSFFRQTESLSANEAEAIGTVFLGAQAEAEEKAAAPQLKNPTVAATKTDPDPETVSPDFFDRMTHELTQILGTKMASLIVHHDVAALGESMEKFPKARVAELLESVTKEIADEKLKIVLRERLGL
jgi:chromosome segregation ATPase